MDYSKEDLKKYREELVYDRLKIEFSIDALDLFTKDIAKRANSLTKKMKKAQEELRELEAEVKAGIKSKSEREDKKSQIKLYDEKILGFNKEITMAVQETAQNQNRIEASKKVIKQLDISIERVDEIISKTK
jgi:chromosome segregation ATPase